MSYPVFYVEAGDALPIEFDSFDGGTGASITMTALAVTDIEVYKDGGVTQRASDNGYALLDTDGIDFDGITGIHGFSIDLNDNSDAGFYVVGPWYMVVIAAVTIDGQTVNFIAAKFRILSATRGMAGTALPDAVSDAAGGLAISDAGGLDLDAMNVNVNDIETDLANATDGLGALKTLIDAIQTDLDNGTDGLGALKALIDTVNTDLANGTDGLGALKALIDTVNTDLANGTDGLGALKTILDTLATTADLLDKLGAVNETAADGDPSATESVMQYVKQIVNVLVGGAGVVTFPAEAAPANAVSLAEVIRAIHADVTGLAGTTAEAIADALLDRTDGIEPASSGTERTLREAMRIMLAAAAGKLSGAATTTVSIRDTNDIKDRIVATVDADGNRSAVTLIDT